MRTLTPASTNPDTPRFARHYLAQPLRVCAGVAACAYPTPPLTGDLQLLVHAVPLRFTTAFTTPRAYGILLLAADAVMRRTRARHTYRLPVPRSYRFAAGTYAALRYADAYRTRVGVCTAAIDGVPLHNKDAVCHTGGFAAFRPRCARVLRVAATNSAFWTHRAGNLLRFGRQTPHCPYRRTSCTLLPHHCNTTVTGWQHYLHPGGTTSSGSRGARTAWRPNERKNYTRAPVAPVPHTLPRPTGGKPAPLTSRACLLPLPTCLGRYRCGFSLYGHRAAWRCEPGTNGGCLWRT